MRLARIAMAMEDGGGASSSVAQPAAMGMGYERHFQPPPFWSTPTPYLFIGFAVVMALIAVALAVLLCTRRKEDEGGRGAEGGQVMAVRVLAPLDREDAAVPRVLVVMAGHSAPSFLASAAPFASFAAAAAGDDAKPQQHVGGKDGADAV
ncbi:hypothetical protein SEVIR_1G053600v4 [Setaria viridis]|uniref:Uncharacterized protein n=2 Tax=Setaria TaxID=4554 RepID=K3YWG0_SETIT|nr:protein GLUTAMINE DUMPER 4 [Setaria italica]XP_034578665.1 protein GLUTAMINE DUMPER 4-like [Setaria viridis]RCV05092.1 hypothetical protein SETIT_1G054400v2 [Setaria italica]TKW37538.1 hypothetical protein SEVIR_1G053600v2 [Setaria viridis]